MSIQVTVSPDTGSVTELYVWDENNPMQAAVKFQDDFGTWHVYLEHKDSGNAPLGSEYVPVGDFPTLHAALTELSAYEGAPVAQFSGTAYGDVIVG